MIIDSMFNNGQYNYSSLFSSTMLKISVNSFDNKLITT